MQSKYIMNKNMKKFNSFVKLLNKYFLEPQERYADLNRAWTYMSNGMAALYISLVNFSLVCTKYDRMIVLF